jgi:hypothetical protein
MPLLFDIPLMVIVIVAIGLVALLTFTTHLLPSARSGRAALLLVPLAFIAGGMLLPLVGRHLRSLQSDPLLSIGLAGGILLVLALAFFARPGDKRRRLERHGWLSIAAALVAAAVASAILSDEARRVGGHAIAVLFGAGLLIAAILVLARRSLQDGQESRIWAITSLVLWPLLFAIALLLFVLAKEA